LKFIPAPLPYDHTALETHIDARTMRLHHASQVEKRNAGLEDEFGLVVVTMA